MKSSHSVPIEALKIKEFEKEHNLNLPSEYKTAVVGRKLHNYEQKIFAFVGADNCNNETNIDTFFDFAKDGDSVPSNYKFYVSAGRLPPFLLPIASCIAGNLICLILSSEKYGAVCYWDHELELELDPKENLAILAPDFEKFLQSLQSDTSR